MNKLLLLPQEIETFYVLPTLRKHLAQQMKERGWKQKDIAHTLGINSATISQYASTKRGSQIKFDPEILAEIQKSAHLIHDRPTYVREVQRLLRFIRITNTLCQIHKQFSPIPTSCDPQEIGCHNHIQSCHPK